MADDGTKGPGVRSCGPQRTLADLAEERGEPAECWAPGNDTERVAASPLESRLLGALLDDGHFRPMRASSDLIAGWGAHGLLLRQLPVTCASRRHYADFAIIAPRRDLFLVVEVDGREFHDLTRTQAEGDRQRERRLTAAGWTVVRFAGREVWRDPRGCAEELVSICKARSRGGR